jgi:trehalose 6-phosphate synthase/phosphatase
LISHPDADFVFCAGDDRTDEDMFRALRRSELSSDTYFCTTIGASNKKTMAGWHVNSPEELIRFMQKLNE